MYPLISSLFVLPLVISGLLLVLPKFLSRIFVIITAIILSSVSIYLFISIPAPIHLQLPLYVNQVVAAADILLLLFFAQIAIRRKNLLVGLLTAAQLIGTLYLITSNSLESSFQLVIDKLSCFMFLLINIISGIIAVFSLKYIDEENCSTFRKKYFLSILFWFIAVMNLLVSSDNLEYFFLFFELTTLASFLLIGFRKDETSVKNALTALWMNQIGGVAILIAVFFISYNGYGEITFSNLLQHGSAGTILMPLTLLSIAALIKGAQMPFSKWLLGAMVAPTPVSALLHSSTMVKIAPFMILRLSPALKGTPIAWIIIGLTGFVFAASAVVALSQDNFKRILAHSTIALLALMIMMGAVGTPVTVIAALTLIVFHGISKCMLFLNAGVLERMFHLKQTSDMDRLAESGPFTSLVLTFGFMSLLLPPFGAFIGKWFSIETIGALSNERIVGALVIVLIALGSAVFSLLYFKVLGLLIARTGRTDKFKFERENPYYTVTILILLALIIGGVLGLPFLLTDYFSPVASSILKVPVATSIEGWGIHVESMRLPIVPMIIAFLLLPTAIALGMFVKFKNVDRAKEYTCGEKIDYSFSALYFSTDKATPYLTGIGILLFAAMVMVAWLI
jgi:ech hydrogenase subunit A